jgi:hypothetical protein
VGETIPRPPPRANVNFLARIEADACRRRLI